MKRKLVLEKVYNPKLVEKKIYQFWEKSKLFNPDHLPKRHKRPYSIVIPPPNVTGELHIGHALNATCQDILIRWKRMKGFKTLWLPGTDHAGIATQYVVEKQLKKENLTRFDLGKEKFIERVWQWVKKCRKIILEQFKKLGCSLDWSRTRFTLDKEYSQAVKKAFFYYYKKGLIYKGKRPINWCPRCQTSLSDLEIEYKKEEGKLWYIKYPFAKNENSFLIVATTRPETIFGDTALAVNPKDKRYKELVKKKIFLSLPLIEREIPLIEDSAVDPDFGTGVLKITPAHDLRDYEISLKHHLPLIEVIDKEGKMIQVPADYQGLTVWEAREKIVKDLEKLGLLVKVEDYQVSIPKCYRCQTSTEILPSEQWFLKMKDLAQMAKKAVSSGMVKFIPKRWEKIYFDWLSSGKDWCISRQIWWGHKIPLRGREEVLDTWFSSALWPFAALGWPKKSKDLRRFYPTDVLSTDRGIINLWVARMIFSGMEFLKKVPFRKVFIHPTVLTKEGKRMSKSLGTGIDPSLLIEKYGADATRWGIVWQMMGGQDIKFVEDNIVMGQKFCNKIWNASRFVLPQVQDSKFKIPRKFKLKAFKLTLADKLILKALKKTILFVDKSLEDFQFGRAVRSLYNFFWHDFCDIYIEKSKSQLKDNATRETTKKVLIYVLLTSLKLLHPFIPFITEQIYLQLPIFGKKKSLMIENWPE